MILGLEKGTYYVQDSLVYVQCDAGTDVQHPPHRRWPNPPRCPGSPIPKACSSNQEADQQGCRSLQVSMVQPVVVAHASALGVVLGVVSPVSCSSHFPYCSRCHQCHRLSPLVSLPCIHTPISPYLLHTHISGDSGDSGDGVEPACHFSVTGLSSSPV
jgi:hypothetical protein